MSRISWRHIPCCLHSLCSSRCHPTLTLVRFLSPCPTPGATHDSTFHRSPPSSRCRSRGRLYRGLPRLDHARRRVESEVHQRMGGDTNYRRWREYRVAHVVVLRQGHPCLLYTSDAADDLLC